MVKVEVQAPLTVVQEPVTWPPSVVKLTAVPSGTGLLKWSDKRAVRVDVKPSMFHPSVFIVVAANEKPLSAGIPVVIVSWFDWVVSTDPKVAPGSMLSPALVC